MVRSSLLVVYLWGRRHPMASRSSKLGPGEGVWGKIIECRKYSSTAHADTSCGVPVICSGSGNRKNNGSILASATEVFEGLYLLWLLKSRGSRIDAEKKTKKNQKPQLSGL